MQDIAKQKEFGCFFKGVKEGNYLNLFEKESCRNVKTVSHWIQDIQPGA